MLRATIIVLLLVGCQHQVKYMDDSAFVSPAIGNSPEISVTVNGKPCVDTDGQPGLCAVRAKTGIDLTVQLSGEPYAYQLDLVCSSSLAFDGQFSSPSEQELTITVPSAKMVGLKSFTCIGTMLPQDRPEPVSSSFEFRATVVSADYQARESVQVTHEPSGWKVYPGKYAMYTFVRDAGIWVYHSDDTSVDVSGPDVVVTSESRLGRRNVYRGPAD